MSAAHDEGFIRALSAIDLLAADRDAPPAISGRLIEAADDDNTATEVSMRAI